MRILFYICFTFALLVSCSENAKTPDGINQDKVLLKIVQTFEDDTLNETEIYEYEYERPSDIFWQKAVLKDSSGEIISITSRKLDKRTRLPIEEYVEEMGEITESYKVVYSANTGDLLLKDEYEGKFNKSKKIKSTKYDYINGVLKSRTVATYSMNDNFRNEDNGNYVNTHKIKFFPPVNTRPAGNFETDFYFEYRKKYEDDKDNELFGKIKFKEVTEFDDSGYPVFHSTTEPGCAHEGFAEWFDYKLDNKGRIVELKAFDNELKTKRSQHSSKINYTYDKNGYINRITDFKYSVEDDDYTNIHDLQVFEWLFDDDNRCYDFNFTNEHYCFTGQRHSLYKKVVIFDYSMTKTIEEYWDAYIGEYKSQELKPKLFKKTRLILAPKNIKSLKQKS